ncbi:nuclear transport factor 2 family protein [Massilia sp. IC2-477]|uniref:nuclear transport factor 2 family protein n=1 Tax=Massilia sp. IC2-477 TaxID=2887198 RepID=UPI001D103F11|nr:nuclear transport factor 2 family protein [Massilia sp. IC2-477]MCC2958379.1 nuclear transport factor 2 family protein [Massilia sp. IC2-477]
MSEQQNVDLVRQAYTAFANHDLEHVLGCMAPTISWEIPAVPQLCFTGRRQGREQVAEYFRMNSELQETREFTPREFIAQGDKVVVLGHGAWTARDTGREFESDWVHIFTVADSQITAFREFLDVHVAVEAFQCFPLAKGASAPAPH